MLGVKTKHQAPCFPLPSFFLPAKNKIGKPTANTTILKKRKKDVRCNHLRALLLLTNSTYPNGIFNGYQRRYAFENMELNFSKKYNKFVA
jgi:hypothetical protein